ncbi:hypothetical protein L218DRAFT_905355 [Marasmius fiardii PR-910]|nr:hypothetical protein L218DRAFT_905355 [Marasmius fiardii PR-910]
MRSALVILSTVASALAAASPWQLQSLAPGFEAASKQGCISASEDDASAVIHDCNTEDVSKHTWLVDFSAREHTGLDPGPQTIKLAGTDKCLDVKDGSNADGTRLQLWTCTEGNANQQWINAGAYSFQWVGTDKCIDLPDGSIIDGTQLQIWTCDYNNPNQRFSNNWVPNNESAGSQLIGGRPDINRPTMCLVAESDTEGAGVALAVCANFTDTFPAGNRTWIVPTRPLVGPITTYGGSKCLDVSGDGSNGNLLKVATCVAGSTNQQWKFNDPPSFTISLAGKNKCIDITNGNLTAGNPVQIWDCDSENDNQMWFVNQE